MASRVTRSRRQASELQEQQHQQQQSRARWTTCLTKILVELMVVQVNKGNRHNNSFGKKAWKYMCDEFRKKTGMNWDKEKLKNRYAVLRRQHGIVKSVLDQSDFSWDESTGIIVASNEAWTEYIKGHPDAEAIKSSGCPIYKELCTIFSEPATNGKHDQSTEIKQGIPLSQSFLEPLTILEESLSEYEEVEDVTDEQDMIQLSTLHRTNNRKRGRKGIDDAIARAILEMAAASKMRTDAVKQYHARYSVANCVEELNELQGVDEELYLTALVLFNSPNAREIFLSLKIDKRLTWLRGKCTGLSSALCS